MSLTTKKTINSISLSATSTINGVDVLTLTTQVTNSASYSNVAQTIINQQAYDQNKSDVRKDIMAFQDAIFDAQDELDSSADSTSVASSSASSAASSAASAVSSSASSAALSASTAK